MCVWSLVSGQKARVNAKTKSKILHRRPLFLIWSSPLNLLARTKIRTTSFHRAPPGYEHAPPNPRASIVPLKEANRPYPPGKIWGWKPFFLVPEFEVKNLSVLFEMFFSPSIHAILAPGLFEAKDLTFEAKDIELCHQGQGRP